MVVMIIHNHIFKVQSSTKLNGSLPNFVKYDICISISTTLNFNTVKTLLKND